MIERIQSEINRIVGILERDQASDGSWRYCAETGILTDAYMIILLRSLEINDEDLISALVERILYRQERNGAWKLFTDEVDGNVSSTIEAYYALLYSGYCQAEDERIMSAKQFIVAKGGLKQASMMTKAMLALNGQYSWKGLL